MPLCVAPPDHPQIDADDAAQQRLPTGVKSPPEPAVSKTDFHRGETGPHNIDKTASRLLLDQSSPTIALFMSNRVAVSALSKAYGAAVALHPTDLVIEPGEFVVIVGPSGCGKSTLLRLIAGLDTPSSGRVYVDEQDVTDHDPGTRDIAMVFQSYALYPHLSVAENIGFPLRMAKLPKAEIAARVNETAAMLEVGDLLDRRPRQLSGGQRQRVSLGRAIVRKPKVLLLDEPLSNLDMALRMRMRQEFARLHQRLGTTMILVTHDQLEAMTLANRIVVMHAGRVEQVGSPIELYRRPLTVRVATAMSSPAINLLPVTISEVRADGVEVVLPNGLRCPVAAAVGADAVGAAATLGVRPEHLQPAIDGPFVGLVELFERLGPLSFAHLAGCGSDSIAAQLSGDQHVELGEQLSFAVPPEDALLFDADERAYPAIL